MAKISNPVKSYKYDISFNGITQALCQSVEIGDIEIEKMIHFDGGQEVKTPGMPKIPDVTIEKMVSSEFTTADTWAWFQSGFNIQTGRQQAPSSVYRDGTITLKDGNGLAVRTWIIEDAWVTKFTPSKVGDGENSNSIDKVVLSVNKIYPVKI